MEKKTVRSGAPFVLAGFAVFAFALILGIGRISDYLLAAGMGCLAFALGKMLFPDRTIEVEIAPRSGDAAVDALIAEARAQLAEIRRANDIIAEPQLSAQIDDIEATCRQLLSRLEEQPQMLSSLRTFLRYYLPTTLKLLNARAALEGEIASGRSAAIASRIRDAMAQVQSALHKQLDALNEYRFINLESEMDALADMLKSDGLTADSADYASEADADTAHDPFAGLFASSNTKATSSANTSSQVGAGTAHDPFAGMKATASNAKVTSSANTSSGVGAGTARGGTK